MAFRFLRICSSPDLLNYRLTELQNQVLIPRGYKPSLVKKTFDAIKKMNIKEALEKVKKKENEKIVLLFLWITTLNSHNKEKRVKY